VVNNVGNILLEKEILLESGTNEVEVLVFVVGGYTFGINVAKVREVLPNQSITALPKAHPSVVGCFRLREQVVPCVSLHCHLNERPTNDDAELTIILTEFNQFQIGFVVDSVERIHRISWERVMAVPSVLSDGASPVTAVAYIDQRMVIMLDFEMIADQVSQQGTRPEPVANPNNIPRERLKILLADDSATVRATAAKTLRESGYTNVTLFEDGGRAWEWIQQRFQETGDASQVADLIVSDVEMPCIDGFRLTKNIKTHPQLCQIPVMLYSSIVTPENLKKGDFVKADAQITKPELAKIVEMADEIIQNSLSARATDSQTAPKVTNPIKEASPAEEAPRSTPAVTTRKAPAVRTVNADNDDLWATFADELSGRIEDLHVSALTTDECVDTQNVQATQRTLHAIKSAAMVLGITEVTRATHKLEDLVGGANESGQNWPTSELHAFESWLAEIVDATKHGNDTRVVLGREPFTTAGATE
jgi:two-component system, chemotaxis family, chemotaxis protein CheV